VHVVAYTEAPTLGGADISLSLLVQALDPGIRVTVVGTEPAVVDRIAAARPGADAEIVRPIRGKLDVPAIVGLARTFARLRPDILHANLNTPVACRYALAIATLLPRVAVVAVEQLATVTPPTRLQRLLKRATSRRLAAHIGVGERAAREIERLFGLRANSIRVIHNAVPDEEPNRLARSVAGPIVGSVGRLDRQKGYDVLVRALAQLPDVQAVVVGDGPERDALTALAEEIGVGDRLSLPGWRDDARAYLATFDVFALPSRFEGFPLAVLEAMLAEVPVVASDVGSVSEAVIDGETGLLVAPDDVDALASAIARLLRDGDRAALGREGRKRVLDRFSVERMARQFEAVYSEVSRA
jgi:glycosyltransferase involved in cell wall biosynthesis